VTDIRIIKDAISSLENDDSHTAEGSELIFHGRVRSVENGQKIKALEYEYYPGMAEKKLRQLADQAKRSFKIQSITCIHRAGIVAVGEISVRIVIWSVHRAEGLKALDWFIVKLKEDVPIWKWGIPESGDKFPSNAK
jgi:molybdopterin synthase catalytic subunit